MKNSNLVEIATSAESKQGPPRNGSVVESEVRRQEAAPTAVSIEKLLDVISSILADEYIEVVKRNPEMFGGEK